VLSTIELIFIVPKRIAGAKADRKNGVSIEIVWVKIRIPPRIEYLLSEPRPVKKSRKGSIPTKTISAKTPYSVETISLPEPFHGIKATGDIAIRGAIMGIVEKRYGFIPFGVMLSFVKSLLKS
jgi:hypothetical protein